MTDEHLDYWGEFFTFFEVGRILGITFAQFLLNPLELGREACGYLGNWQDEMLEGK